MDQSDATSGDSSITSFDRVGMATRRAGAFRLTDVDPTGIRWLWPERIPLGYVTLLRSRRRPKNVLHGPLDGRLPDQMRKNRGGFCATDQITDEFAQVARN